MTELRYTEDHAWVKIAGDDAVIVGISNHAQSELGDIVFVELPKIGATLTVDDIIAVVESVKTAAEVKAPLSGTVVEINEELKFSPELVNASPTEAGWLLKLKIQDSSELGSLMNQESYDDFVAEIN